MRVLVACEYTGTVRDAFIAAGHYAVSCDIIPSVGGEPHIKGDVLDFLDQDWDLMIGHPPCTYLSNAGAMRMKNQERYARMAEGAAFFRKLWEAPIPRICLENPVPMRAAVSRIGRNYDQVIEPWQFGHPVKKKTCLWLKNLPELKPTKVVYPTYNFLDYFDKVIQSKDGRVRSMFWSGMAEAMAEQWGNLD